MTDTEKKVQEFVKPSKVSLVKNSIVLEFGAEKKPASYSLLKAGIKARNSIEKFLDVDFYQKVNGTSVKDLLVERHCINAITDGAILYNKTNEKTQAKINGLEKLI